MANQHWPEDEHHNGPVQTLTFTYERGHKVYFWLHMKPNAARTLVGGVDITYQTPGFSEAIVLTKGQPHSVIAAGTLAYNQAQTEGQAHNLGKIVHVQLDTREFLAPADVTNIVGNAFPVILQ